MIRILLLVAVSFFAVGCSLPPHIETLEEQANDAEKIKTAKPVQVVELDWQFVPPEDWETEEEWNTHVSQWKAHYFEFLTSDAQFYTEGEWSRVRGDIVHVPAGQEPSTEGIVVKAAVHDIRREYGFIGKNPDHIIATVVITDAASGEVLHKARYDAWNADKGVGFKYYTFGGRMMLAVRSLVWEGIAVVLRDGKMPATEG